jgi:hypothetical protein
MAIDTCVEKFFGALLKALAASISKCRPRDHTRPLIPAGSKDKIRLRTGCGGGDKSPETPL